MKRMTVFVILAAMVLRMLPLGAGAEEQTVENRLAAMPLREKITQMLMVDFRNWDENTNDDAAMSGFTVMNDQVRDIVQRYRFGAVIYFAQNLTGTEQAYHLTQALQQAAVKDGGIPMMICTDQEGGSVYRLGTGTALPGNMALGAAGDRNYGYLSGRIIGSELRALGINTNLAPVVDVNSNAANPVIGLRSYGDDPVQVGQMASAAISGMSQFDVVGCAKHFPGHGDTAVDSHYGLPRVDKTLEELLECELKPYEILMNQGIEMIMTAHILYPQLEDSREYSRKTGKMEALPASMSPKIIQGLLKETLGFEGIVVTDAMNMAGIADHWDSVQAVVQAIKAGADMICMPCTLEKAEDVRRLEAILRGVEEAVENGEIPMERIDDGVRRILTVKENRGILDWKAGEPTLEAALAIVGGEANREAERHMAAAAVTVVENKNNTLPLRLTEQSRVLMLVPYENEKAQMLLGWNRVYAAGLIPQGAQVDVVRFSKNATLDTFRTQIDWADVLIFNSEIGSSAGLNGGRWESAYILQVLEYAENRGKTTIVQSVDKPYDVQTYPKADAVVAVYGCKGSTMDPTEVLVGGATGAADAFGPNIVAGIEVILGVFGAKGKLPVDIPVLENGHFTEEIRYPRGYGITYDSLIPQPEIPEMTTEAEEESVPTTIPAIAESETEGEPKRHSGWILPALAAAAALLLLKPRGKRRRRRR